jgi:uncharacterized damage-inducible protein DinB
MNYVDRAIEVQFERMEKKKKLLMELILSIPEVKYRHQPNPQSWSVAQASNHLYLSEKLSLAYLRKKLSYPDTIPRFHIKSWWGMFVYKIILTTIIKAKAPKQINMWENQEVLLAEQLDQKWSELRIELFDFIREQFPQFRNHLVYNHPFAGRLSMRQMLIFFNDHIHHHTKQIQRILKEIERDQ